MMKLAPILLHSLWELGTLPHQISNAVSSSDKIELLADRSKNFHWVLLNYKNIIFYLFIFKPE
jgi:hypothetical protein